MMPPECPLCDKTLQDLPHEKFEAVSFRTPPGYVESDLEGHPDHIVWFCSDHFAAAEALSGQPWEEARRSLERRFPR